MEQPDKNEVDGDSRPAQALESTLVARREFAGPLPPPELLARYNEIIPALGSTIVELALSEADHRRRLEHALVETQCQDTRAHRRERRRGQYFAFMTCGLAIVGGVVVACVSQTWSGQAGGALMGMSGLTGVIATFMTGRSRDKTKQSAE